MVRNYEDRILTRNRKGQESEDSGQRAVRLFVLFVVPASAQGQEGNGTIDWWTVGVTLVGIFVAAIGTVAAIVMLVQGMIRDLKTDNQRAHDGIKETIKESAQGINQRITDFDKSQNERSTLSAPGW